MHIIKASDSRFDDMWKKLIDESDMSYPLYQINNLAYYEQYWKESHSSYNFINHSFLLEEDKIPLAGIYITSYVTKYGRRHFSAYNLPSVFIKNNTTINTWKVIRKELESLFVLNTSWDWLHFEGLPNGNISEAGRYILSAGGVANIKWSQKINLLLSEDDIFKGLSKGCRAGIKWGVNNLKIRLINSSTITEQDIEDFRNLHKHVAGKETRSKNTWMLQYNMVLADEAFLIFGYYNDELITAALFSHSNKYCYYGVSASKRELFDKPISHMIIWSAIKFAKNVGCHWFDMAGQSFISDIPSPTHKELMISRFKHSFGGETTANIIFKLSSDS